MKKRLIPMLLILALLLGMTPALAAEPEFKGEFDDFAWVLEPLEGILTVTGEGAIPDFSYSEGAPWYPYRSRVFKAVLDERITAIGAYAFSDCSRLVKLDAEGCTLSAIGEGAFSNCVLLETASFVPAQTLDVGGDAFYGCAALKSVDLGAEEGTLGSGAFAECAALEEAALPGDMARLEDETFCNCRSLAKIVLPETLEYIGKRCFRGCAALTELRFPATLETVERYAFSGCEALAPVFEGDAPAFAPAKDASASFAPGVTLRFAYDAADWHWPVFRGYETEYVYPGLETVFNDVVLWAWYIPDVQHVYYSGLMNGVSETAFAPDRPMTRAQLVMVLYRMAGSPLVEADNPFRDVAETAYYYDAVRWAQSNGIVTGLNESTFGPDSRITRQQMCAFLYRYAAMLKLPLTRRDPLTSFTDAATVADYARDPVAWCVGMGFVNGKPGGLLDPEGDATRAQIAKVLTCFDSYLSREALTALDRWEEGVILPETLPDIDREDPLYIYAREIFDAINAKRAELGLRAYVWNDRIFLAAQVRSRELSEGTELTHVRPDGSKYYTALAEYNVNTEPRNEIVAMGYPTAKALVDTWYNAQSTTHVISAVIYSQAAVGVAQLPPAADGTPGKYYYTLLVIG